MVTSVKTLVSNKRCASSIPGLRVKIPPALGQNKTKQNRNSIVTNSIMTLKMVHIKKKKKTMTTYLRSFKNQNGVTTVQASRMESDGHCSDMFLYH